MKSGTMHLGSIRQAVESLCTFCDYFDKNLQVCIHEIAFSDNILVDVENQLVICRHRKVQCEKSVAIKRNRQCG